MHAHAAPVLFVVVTGLLLGLVVALLSRGNASLCLQHLALCEFHRVTQLGHGLAGVLVGLLVLVELREDGADVEDRAGRVALDGAQVNLELEVVCVHLHQVLQISFLFFVVFEARFVV